MDFFSVPVAPPHSPPQHHPSAAASPAAPPALNDPPPYAEMIYAAITALKKKGGSSKIAIGKHMEQTYSNLPANHSTLLSEHLHHLKNTGHLRMVKKSYKLPISNAPVPETNNNNNQDRRPRKVQAQAQPISYAIGEANAVVPVRKSKSTRPVGRPRKQPFVALHPSAAASPAALAAPVAPSALDHPPPYAEMIYAAITALKEKGGSSKIAIGKHMEQTYSNLPANHSTLLTDHLHHLKNTGRLHMVKRSYKLPKSNASVPETNNNQDNAEANAAVPVRRSKRRPGKVLISDPFGEANAAVPVKNVGSSRGRGRSKRTGSPVGNSKKDEVVRQREVTCPSEELQQVRDDRDRQVLQVLALTAELQQVRDDRDHQVLQVHALTVELAAANEKLKMYECRFLEEEALRIKMHNDMMELKGNIRVFCRVRPLLPKEGVGHHESPISYPTSTEYRGRGIDVLENGQTHNFAFNKVFSPTASQQDVFGEVSGLVQSVMDGYKVCIFAYGQTGSGKTYTMLGRPEALEQKGLIPRSLEQIFQLSHSTPGWKYRIQASMFEIYNGKIYDLLDPSTGSVSVQKQGLKVLLDANKVAQVVGLTISDVGSIEEVFLLLKRATQVRSVGKTQMNEQSSRSHLVFKLQISGVNEDTKQQVQGVLNLVDLAGSERPAADASGDRLEEAKEINKSLSYLSQVINAIVMKDAHIPFRNSILTRVLEPYLGKDSKTLMVVNISPNPSSVGESINSLRFAADANACARQVVRPPPMSVQRGASSKLKVPPCWT